MYSTFKSIQILKITLLHALTPKLAQYSLGGPSTPLASHRHLKLVRLKKYPICLLNHVNKIRMYMSTSWFNSILNSKGFNKKLHTCDIFVDLQPTSIYLLRAFTVSCGSSSARALTLFLLSLSLCHEFRVVFNQFVITRCGCRWSCRFLLCFGWGTVNFHR